MSLLGPKVSLSPMGNERPGWDSSPSSDMSFITLTLNGGNDEHFGRVITRCVPLMSEGKSGMPSFNIWLFFFCVIWSNSSCEPFICSLCDICLMRMSWLLDSDIVLAFDIQFLLVPILATASAENFPLTPFQLLQNSAVSAFALPCKRHG